MAGVISFCPAPEGDSGSAAAPWTLVPSGELVMTRHTRIILVVGTALALNTPALADDTAGSIFNVSRDWPREFQADGILVNNDTNLNGINNGPGQALNPTTFLHIPGYDGHWSFDLWYVVDDWDMPAQPGVIDGAHNTRLGLRGVHHTAPHAGENADNVLPPVLGGEIVGGIMAPADIRFNSGALLAVSATQAHGDHRDWYRAKSNAFAYDLDPFDPAVQRRVQGTFDVEASHPEDGEADPWPDYGTLGSTPAEGTHLAFEPDSGTLRIVMGPVSILDRDGGRTGTIAPEFVGDPLVGVPIQIVELHLVGLDPLRNAFVFRGGDFFAGSPGATAIGGQLDELLIPADAAIPTPIHCAMSLLWITESGNADDASSPWARRFIDEDWFSFGDDLNIADYPCTWISAETNLVAATNGFTSPALVPATVVLTMLTRPGIDCIADFNHDGVIDFFDILSFLGAFDAGDAAADLNHDGTLDFFDVLAFLQAFANGCH